MGRKEIISVWHLWDFQEQVKINSAGNIGGMNLDTLHVEYELQRETILLVSWMAPSNFGLLRWIILTIEKREKPQEFSEKMAKNIVLMLPKIQSTGCKSKFWIYVQLCAQ